MDMPVTQGSASKINPIKGYAAIIQVTDAELKTLPNVIFKSGLLMKFPDNNIYLTDGVTKLSELKPIIEGVISKAAAEALHKAFLNDVYQAVEGGIAVLSPGAKVDDAQLSFISDGKVVESYLSDYVEDGQFKLDTLPDLIRQHVRIVKDIATRDAIPEEQRNAWFLVTDATADKTVEQGWAVYIYQDAEWVKVMEGESLDIDVEALTPNYEHIEAAGAVMYDHDVNVKVSLSEFNELTSPEQVFAKESQALESSQAGDIVGESADTSSTALAQPKVATDAPLGDETTTESNRLANLSTFTGEKIE